MHVVVLDDGRELHVRSGDVDYILVLNQCPNNVDSDAPAHDSYFKVPGGHVSSQERADNGPSQGSYESSLFRTFTSGDPSFDEDVDKYWLSLTELAIQTTDVVPLQRAPGPPRNLARDHLRVPWMWCLLDLARFLQLPPSPALHT